MNLYNIIKKTEESIVAEALNAGTWAWDIKTGAHSVNERWAELMGYSLDEIDAQSIEIWETLMYPSDQIYAKKELAKLFDKNIEHFAIEVRLKHKKGHWVWVRDYGKVVKWDKNGEPQVAIGALIDITETKKVQLELADNEKNLRQIIENTYDIIYRIDTLGNFLYLSNAWTKHLGFSVESAIGRSFEPYVHPDDIETIRDFFKKIGDSGHKNEVHGYRLLTKDNTFRYYQSSASAIVEDGQVIGYAGIARDIHDAYIKQQTIEYLSYHDYLTNFKNRHYLDKFENKIIQQTSLPLAVIVMDLNNLKYVNDLYGHHIGDQMVKDASDVITKIIKTEYLIRMGGDEFLILIPNCDVKALTMLIKQVNKQIAILYKEVYPIELSIGYYIVNDLEIDLKRAIRLADKNMYIHKEKLKASKTNI